MKKKPQNEDSDEFEADEPEEFDESGSDWDPEEEDEQPKKKRGRSKAGSKKVTPTKKKKLDKPPSDEEEEEEEEAEEDEDEESEGGVDSGANGSIKGFANGSFVVLKNDFEAGGKPPLWRIDGKALLQKYVPFEQDGKTLYRNTSTYSGWTQSNRDQYTAAPVVFIQQGKKEIIIEFNREGVNLQGSAAAAAGAAATTATSSPLVTEIKEQPLEEEEAKA